MYTKDQILSFNQADLFDNLGTSIDGLTKSEVEDRQKSYGKNSLNIKKVSNLSIFLRQFKSPFIFLLFGSAILAIFLGEPRDSLFIFLFVSLNAILGFLQERKSEATAKNLSDLLHPKVKVRRGGDQVTIPSESLVIGDILILEPGDIAQADCRIVKGQVRVDESILTGESEPVEKSTELSPLLESGTTIVSGFVEAVVYATGTSRRVGGLLKLTYSTQRVSTFEKGLSKISGFILRVVAITLVLVVVLNILLKGTDDISHLLLFAIALAVSVIPEALPVVITFSLSQGASRLAKNNVIVKRLSAIEDLGGISVLCTDKTGTITENRLTHVKSLVYKKAPLKLLSYLSQPEDSFDSKDPFDIAISNSCSEEIKDSAKRRKLISIVPFDHHTKSTEVEIKYMGENIKILKGAPEGIMQKVFGKIPPEIDSWVKKEGEEGRRVIAVSYAKKGGAYKLAGLLSFVDPLKDTTMAAIVKARDLGVSVKILTGDRSEVATAVGRKIGILGEAEFSLPSEEFLKMDLAQKMMAVEKYNVFSRTTPEVKYEIVSLLQKKHEVGFLGEGFNDAPSLKEANVGIAVQSASDVSRSAADIILLDKSLLTIVEGIEAGRMVFANTVKYLKATLTSNFGNFYAVAVASLLVPFLPLLPIQILLLNLLSDLPMISVSTDKVDREQLSSPQSYDIKDIATSALVLGAVSTFFDFMTFAIFTGRGESALQTAWFLTSVLTEIVLIFSLRTRRLFFRSSAPSRPLVVLSVVATMFAFFLVASPLGAKYFSFTNLSISTFGLIALIVIGYFTANELAKRFVVKNFAPGGFKS